MDKFFRSNGRDVSVAGEIAGIKGENMRDTVGEHKGGDTGVVRLFAHCLVVDNDPLPAVGDVGRLGKTVERDSNLAYGSYGVIERKAASVYVARSCQDNPKLSQNLGAHKQPLTLPSEQFYCRNAFVVTRVSAISKS